MKLRDLERNGLKIIQNRWRVILAIIVLIILIWVGYVWLVTGRWPDWTGFGTKTLWDLMQLLIIPAILAGGAYWLNESARKREQAVTEQRAQETALQTYLDKMTELLLDKKLRESEQYLFNWDFIPENGTEGLIEFLIHNFHIDWVKTAKVEKIDGGKAIKISTEKNSLYLRVYDIASTTIPGVKIEIDDGRIDEFNFFGAKIENGKLNVYSRSSQDLEVRAVARARTLTVLRRLDKDRKAALLWFLYEADLITHEIFIDLSGADLSGANLMKADLSSVFLMKANLSYANLSGAILRSANLRSADLREANLRSANLRSADLREANLSRADLRGDLRDRANLSGANLSWADLSYAHLSWAFLSGANLRSADLRSADLRSADLSWAYLFSWDEIPGNDNGRLIEFLEQNFGIYWVKTEKIDKTDDGRTINVSADEKYLSLELNNEKTRVNLKIYDDITHKFITKTENGKLNICSGANLNMANLSGANLSGAFLSGANLNMADLREANLSGAFLSGANLNMANLSGADLRGANLSSAHLRSADLREANLRSADLREANLRQANLRSADLNKAKYTKYAKHVTDTIWPTIWPAGVDPDAAGAVCVNE